MIFNHSCIITNCIHYFFGRVKKTLSRCLTPNFRFLFYCNVLPIIYSLVITATLPFFGHGCRISNCTLDPLTVGSFTKFLFEYSILLIKLWYYSKFLTCSIIIYFYIATFISSRYTFPILSEQFRHSLADLSDQRYPGLLNLLI